MKRVLFVDHVDRILGGAEINLIELIEEAQKHGEWKIAVACRKGSVLSEALDKSGVQQFDYGFAPRLNQLRFAGSAFPWLRIVGGMRAMKEGARELAQIIGLCEPTHVISCTNKDHFVASQVSPNSIWWVNDLLTQDFFPSAARTAFRFKSKNARRLIAVSNCVKEALMQLGIPSDKISVIHNGIPISKYTATKKGAFREAQSFGDSQPIFGLIGRICEWKGHFLFEQIAAEWKRQQKPGRFVMIGGVHNEDEVFGHRLESGARNAQRANTTDVPTALADMDVLLHTSLRPEPFGRVIIEAMAAGVPVVAADAGGAREIIRPGENGFLARTNDVASYIEKLSLLYPRTPAVEKIIANARATVAEKFTVERVYRDFDQLLSTI
jgi:glycosyltransferase involved in cell wall biosynthesis